MVHLVLHPHGIAPTFLNWILDRQGRVFIPIIYNKPGNKSVEKVNCEKKVKFYK